MRFWDSSAIVPLVCAEEASAQCRAWLKEDQTVLVWTLTAIEVISALTRRRREGAMKPAVFQAGKQRLAHLESAWSEVTQVDAVRARARRLLESHPLRAADALQLAAALVAVEEQPSAIPFVTFDDRLAEAARREGFAVPAQ
jgi:predicted nucleic acid-binding protein